MAYKLKQNVEIQAVNDKLIVLDLTGNAYYALNESARFMLEKLISGSSSEAVIEAAAAYFDAPKDVISSDLCQLICDLKASALIVDA